MKKDLMALCDADGAYVYRLQELLARRGSFPFRISVCTERNSFREELKKGVFSLVLAGDGFYEDVMAMEESKRPLLLRLGEKDVGETEGTVWKYQSGEKIRQKIMDHYAAKARVVRSAEGGHATTLLGVFSPVCRSIQTSFSLLMGQFLAKKSSVLYLNFEPFSGLQKLLGGAGDRDLTDLVYYLEGGKERLVYKLESMVGNVNGLDYISPAFSFLDLGQVNEESWLCLIRTLREMGNYDYVILDLSEMVQGLLNVLRECDSIYTITDREGMTLYRMEQYEELLQSLDYGDILERCKRLELPKFRKLPSSIEELPYSDLAAYVKKLLEEQ
ncbi:MAG: hypothetical protein K6E50_02400 [Lachnospiraceae bacterium]|nr:hypothetical protein [Lachnospiraceae bacterium]